MDIERLKDKIAETVGEIDPVEVLNNASGEKAVKRLAEMRLLVLSQESSAVLGMTRLGRDVLVGLLYVLFAGSDRSIGSRDEVFFFAAQAAQIVAWEDMDETAKQAIEEFARLQEEAATS